MLIGRELQSDWIDWSDQLLCDRAVTVRTERTSADVHPYTISTGLDAGWSWQIPLTETTGNGYVYSSRHLTADQAAHQLLQSLGLSESQATVREVRFRTEKRRAAWVANCVAIGLSAGFIEPLESTGIFLVQRAIDDLAELLLNQPPAYVSQRPSHSTSVTKGCRSRFGSMAKLSSCTTRFAILCVALRALTTIGHTFLAGCTQRHAARLAGECHGALSDVRRHRA